MFARALIARYELAKLVSRPDGEIRLAEACLLIAHEEYPDLDPAAYLRRLEALAERVRRHTSDRGASRLDAVSRILFDEEGFRGNRSDYYDARNSFLNDVIDRRLGLPIALSIVFLDVCRRVGLTAAGIGLPGHFVVVVDAPGAVLLDPFNGGKRLTLDDCAVIVRDATGGRFAFQPGMLRPMTARQILMRVLNNLRGIYLNSGDYVRLLAVLDRLLLLDPDALTEIRDRALVCEKLHFFGQAMADLRGYLGRAPNAPDAEALQGVLAKIGNDLAWKN